MVLKYFREHDLKYGGIFPSVVDELCSSAFVDRDVIRSKFNLKPDGLGTILSNVTMAIQKTGKVDAPQLGGWCTYLSNQHVAVAPGFAEAWKAVRPPKSSGS